jgi:hypothetical protein
LNPESPTSFSWHGSHDLLSRPFVPLTSITP